MAEVNPRAYPTLSPRAWYLWDGLTLPGHALMGCWKALGWRRALGPGFRRRLWRAVERARERR